VRTSGLQPFETGILAVEENFAGLATINPALIARMEAANAPQRIVLDRDWTEIPIYSRQEQSAYNGHFESICYYALLLFNPDGDCPAAKIRPGNFHSAEGWEEDLLPAIERQQRMEKEALFRVDTAFAESEIYEALEAPGVKHAIPLPANESLEWAIARLLN
jgi:hypothetical protein